MPPFSNAPFSRLSYLQGIVVFAGPLAGLGLIVLSWKFSYVAIAFRLLPNAIHHLGKLRGTGTTRPLVPMAVVGQHNTDAHVCLTPHTLIAKSGGQGSENQPSTLTRELLSSENGLRQRRTSSLGRAPAPSALVATHAGDVAVRRTTSQATSHHPRPFFSTSEHKDHRSAPYTTQSLVDISVAARTPFADVGSPMTPIISNAAHALGGTTGTPVPLQCAELVTPSSMHSAAGSSSGGHPQGLGDQLDQGSEDLLLLALNQQLLELHKQMNIMLREQE